MAAWVSPVSCCLLLSFNLRVVCLYHLILGLDRCDILKNHSIGFVFHLGSAQGGRSVFRT